MSGRIPFVIAALASLSLAGCIAVGNGWPARQHGPHGHGSGGGSSGCCPVMQGRAGDDCPAMQGHGGECEEASCDAARVSALRKVGGTGAPPAVDCKEECEEEKCEEACEEACEEKCEDACEEKCEEACEEECEEECEAQCEEACEEEASCCAEEPAVAAAAAAPVDAEKLDELRYALEGAERRVARAEAEREQAAIDQRHAVRRAKLDLSDAQKALAHFDDFERPMRLARAELDLKGSRDYLTEQEEEMHQLELMYEKDDLGDKTKEIVLARGKRRLSRAKESFGLAQKEMNDLKGVTLPQQREKLEREVSAKERDLERASFQAKTSSEDKNQACVDAERAAAKARRELEKASGAACCAEASSAECCSEEESAGEECEEACEDDEAASSGYGAKEA